VIKKPSCNGWAFLENIMKKYTAKKSGRWAQAQPHLPQFSMKKDKAYAESDIPASLIDMLLSKSFITPFDKVVKVEGATTPMPVAEPHGANFISSAIMAGMKEDAPTIEDTLNNIVDCAIDAEDAKIQLEEWAEENLKINVDRRKSVTTIIKELAEISNGN